MSIHRQAAKRDANEGEIIKSLREVGATVQQLSVKGCADLLVGFRGANWLMEVKVGKAKLTDPEYEWHESWRGQVDIVRSADEALRIIGVLDWQQEKVLE
jgi:hypothetical protein